MNDDAETMLARMERRSAERLARMNVPINDTIQKAAELKAAAIAATAVAGTKAKELASEQKT